MMRTATVHADGAARGNPGPAAIGVVISDSNGVRVRAFGRRIGETTNNVAEYEALIAGLEAARELGFDSVRVMLDSELLVRQMTGRYRVKSPNLKPLHDRARQLVGAFRDVRFEHVPRAQNAHADALCNEALDGASGDSSQRFDDAHPRLF